MFVFLDIFGTKRFRGSARNTSRTGTFSFDLFPRSSGVNTSSASLFQKVCTTCTFVFNDSGSKPHSNYEPWKADIPAKKKSVHYQTSK